MRQGVFSTLGFEAIIKAVLALFIVGAVMAMFLQWLGAWNLNQLLVAPVNQFIPAWFPLEIPDIFP